MSRILLVEDTDVVRDALGFVLRRAGHDVMVATDGEDALAMIGDGTGYDLALVDIWMPRLDGLGLLRRLRRESVRLPVLLMSGGGPGASLEHAVSLADAYGAAGVLFKPFEPKELLAAVDRALGGAAPDDVALDNEA